MKILSIGSILCHLLTFTVFETQIVVIQRKVCIEKSHDEGVIRESISSYANLVRTVLNVPDCDVINLHLPISSHESIDKYNETVRSDE